MRALIVEDQKQMRAIIRKMLQQMKFFKAVDEAEDGERAWAKISEGSGSETYDLVVCDVLMPELDGLSLLKRSRQSVGFGHIPFLMISASSNGATVVSALGEWGASDFIVKPFSFEVLNQRIAAILKRVQSPEECLYREAERLKQEGAVEDALKLIEHWEIENRLSRAKWFNLKGECLMQTGEKDNAAAEFERAIALSNIYVAAYKNYADVHQQLGNIEKAIRALKSIEDIAPTDAERTLGLGRLLLQAGEEGEGKKYLDGLIKRSTGAEREANLKNVAGIYLEGGLFEEAERSYAIILQVNPMDIETSNRLGIALRQQGKYTEAERCYLTALRAHPRHPGLFHNLGILYMVQKDYAKAQKCVQKALDLDPGFEEASGMLETLQKKLTRRN